MLFKMPKILLSAKGNHQGIRISSQGIVLHVPIMEKELKTIELIYHTNNLDPREDFSREEGEPTIIILLFPWIIKYNALSVNFFGI